MEHTELHVIFGTGPLGSTLANSLLNQGKAVRLVSRSGSNPLGQRQGLEVVSADASVPENANGAVEGANVVYNCTNAPYDQWASLLRPLFRGILSAAESVGAPLVVADNLYGYGLVSGPISEATPLNGKTPKCLIRADLVREMMEAHSKGRVEVAIVQGSDFFGPGAINAHMGLRAMAPVLRGKNPYLVGDIDQPHAFTYVPDFVEALRIVGSDWRGFGRTWIVPSGPSLTPRQFIARAASLAGTKSKAKSIPSPVLHAAGFVNSFMRELRETLYQFEQPFTVDSSEFEKTFGFRGTDLDAALRATLSWTAEQAGIRDEAGSAPARASSANS